MNKFPWNYHPLDEWSIVGMNHYHVDGVRHLFVAMSKGSRIIKAESSQEMDVFDSLMKQARIAH